MTAEETLLTRLVGGELSTSEIPLARSSRRQAALRLEKKGMLYRKPVSSRAAVYGLTRSGKLEAANRGLLPVVENLTFFGPEGDEMSVDLLPLYSPQVKPVRHPVRGAFKLLGIYVGLGISSWAVTYAIMRLSGYLQ